jgi:hypothetical protein
MLSFKACLTLLWTWILTGCVMTGLSEVDADPSFNWDVLKRDWILMTPLLDLRSEPLTEPELKFFRKEEQEAYAERFKQEFYRLRKDIRVFGAGGAFEHMAKLDDLPALARRVFGKQPLAEADRARILAGSQDLRFIFFFAVTGESISRDVTYTFRSDQEMDTIAYVSRRKLTMRMALWDSKENRTVWIGTQRLAPESTSQVSVHNPSKRKEKRKTDKPKVYKYVWVGRPLSISASGEWRAHPERFPGVPGREPHLSGSFDDFALSLPIHPSEEKLIEYKWFTYHRPELRLGASALGSAPVVAAQLGSSSIIANRYRVGAAVILPSGAGGLRHDGVEYGIGGFGLGASLDLEWVPADDTRLLTGAMLGMYNFTISPEVDASADLSPAPSRSDFTTFIWPRVQLLFGERRGFQWGVGAMYRAFSGIEEPVLEQHRPSPWAVDLAVAYAFRGF